MIALEQKSSLDYLHLLAGMPDITLLRWFLMSGRSNYDEYHTVE